AAKSQIPVAGGRTRVHGNRGAGLRDRVPSEKDAGCGRGEDGGERRRAASIPDRRRTEKRNSQRSGTDGRSEWLGPLRIAGGHDEPGGYLLETHYRGGQGVTMRNIL